MTEVPLLILAGDHGRLADVADLDFIATEEEFGTSYHCRITSPGGAEYLLIEPAFEADLGVHVYGGAEMAAVAAEEDVLAALGLGAADVSWRRAARQLAEGDVASISPEAPTEYRPDATGTVTEVLPADHPDLEVVPGINSAVYRVQLDDGPELEVPSNLVVWEPILQAEAVDSATAMVAFLRSLAHEMEADSAWTVTGGSPRIMSRLADQLEKRAAASRGDFDPRWVHMAVSILEAAAPDHWAQAPDG